MVVTFDSTGFQREDDTTWRSPTTGDRISLKVVDSPLTEPAWLEDIPAMRRNLAHGYASGGCLIEAEPVVIGGVRGVCQVAKVPLPNAPRGQVFVANIFLAKATGFVMFGYIAAEQGITGMREALIMQRLGVPDNWVLPHPYDPELRSAVPYHRGDDPAWDAQFPEHPLSRARAWVREMVAKARVDPGFAALPDYLPKGAAPAPSTPLDPAWAKIQRTIPKFLYDLEEDSPDGEWVKLTDPALRRGVLFSRQANDVEITVRVPVDPVAAERLNHVVRAQPDQLWRKGRDEWVSGWRNTAPADYRDRVAQTVVAVLREGLSVSPERLRVRVWDDNEPGGTYGLATDQPTESGAPQVATDWADFTARLDWVLQTLPYNAVLIISSPRPSPDEWCYVQYMKRHRLVSEASAMDVAGLGPEFARKLTALGWTATEANWTGPEVAVDHDTRGVPERTVATFREAFGLSSPQGLEFTAFRNGSSDDLGYLVAELGLPRAER
ncbi:TY-Chap domain-containing protein [Actinokineospora sp. HUAS TT18]|uniref:TY-Chap domain-containing protein n=1 Tax=Actinokineospora sp. HUAS TT18 TaxID=3447451 RepID=UPI003F520ECE